MRQNAGGRGYKIPDNQKSIAAINTREQRMSSAADAITDQRYCHQFDHKQTAQSSVHHLHEASDERIGFLDAETQEEQCRAHIQNLEQYEHE